MNANIPELISCDSDQKDEEARPFLFFLCLVVLDLGLDTLGRLGVLSCSRCVWPSGPVGPARELGNPTCTAARSAACGSTWGAIPGFWDWIQGPGYIRQYESLSLPLEGGDVELWTAVWRLAAYRTAWTYANRKHCSYQIPKQYMANPTTRGSISFDLMKLNSSDFASKKSLRFFKATGISPSFLQKDLADWADDADWFPYFL